MKKCTKCQQEKELSEFYNHVKFGPRPECKPCSKARNAENWKKNKSKIDKKNREWQQANKEKLYQYSRKQNLRRKYGITPEQYEKMLISQGNSCSICKIHESEYGTFAVDHCHETNKVRGLLCSACNTALGLLKESITIVDNLKKYLIDHKDKDAIKESK